MGDEVVASFELSEEVLGMQLNEAFQQTLDVVCDIGANMQADQMDVFYSLTAIYGEFLKNATSGKIPLVYDHLSYFVDV